MAGLKSNIQYVVYYTTKVALPKGQQVKSSNQIA